MTTDPEQFRRIELLFQQAIRLDPELRERFLLENCGEDGQLLSEIRNLVRADQLPDGVLDQPILPDGPSLTELETTNHQQSSIPERVATYRIVRVIGEGGMGIVYEAQQLDPQRNVALKVIRHGFHSAGLMRRFKQEAQILGRLKHPGIAQIYEAGTSSNGDGAQPYFAMELVCGQPLLEYAQSHRLGIRARLALMVKICDAVHHAHLNGVIHRDLKPANILVSEGAGTASGLKVTEAADAAQPKILDFGIARAIDSDLQVLTQQTDIGQLVGTIAYMSPEQATGDPEALDVRSDVYALGVIAYELLAGRLPYEAHGKLIHEAARVIREDDPSRLSSINRSFRGDLETIIAKALEKDMDRRYQSAADFSLDIRRYLDDQPIAARPASRLYQLKKFARRNKAIVSGVVIAFVALSIGTIVAVRQAIVAEHAAVDAQRQAYRASLVAASGALRYADVADARRQLDAAPPQLRGWEWDHLSSRLDDAIRSLHVPFHPMCFALSPDGRTLASASSAGVIRLWSVPEFIVRGEYAIKGSVKHRRVRHLIFSQDGSELRAVAEEGAVRVNAGTLELTAEDELAAPVRSEDGRFVVIEGDRRDREWKCVVATASGRELLQFASNGDAALTVFSSDGNLLANYTGENAELAIFRTQTGEGVCRRIDLKDVTSLSFSSDGTRIVVGDGAGVARVIETSTGNDLAVCNGHTAAISQIRFSPDSTRVATASNDHTVRVWDADTGQLFCTMRGNQSAVVDMAFTADGKALITACTDQDVRWWDATATSDPYVLHTPGMVYGVAFSPDGSRLSASCLVGERPLRIWDVASGREVFAGSEGNLCSITSNADGTRIAVGRSRSEETSVVGVDGTEIARVPGHWWRTNWIAFASDQTHLLSLSNGGRFEEQDIGTGKLLRYQSLPGETVGEGCRAAISPDQSMVALACARTIIILDSQTWKEVGQLSGHVGNVYALAFSPDGRRLISGSQDQTLRVWDMATRKPIATLVGHSDEIFAALYSPDGKRIFSGGRDGVIRVWDAQTLEELTQLHGHKAYIYSMAFSPDGEILASGGGDSTVRLWARRRLVR